MFIGCFNCICYYVVDFHWYYVLIRRLGYSIHCLDFVLFSILVFYILLLYYIISNVAKRIIINVQRSRIPSNVCL